MALGLIAQHLHKSFHNKKILCTFFCGNSGDVMKVVAHTYCLCVFSIPRILGAKWFQRCFYFENGGKAVFKDVFLLFFDSWNIGGRWFYFVLDTVPLKLGK